MSYISDGNLNESNFPAYTAVKEQLGFFPNLFQAQGLRPDLVQAQLQLTGDLLVKDGALTRQQKEYVFLVSSAANMSTYCVTAHCEIVRILGLHGPEPERIAMDHNSTDLPLAMKALLNFAVKLNTAATRINESDIATLRTFGYDDPQILETVALVGLAKFANVVAAGLGTVPDFDPSLIRFKDKEEVETAGQIL